MRKDEPAKQTTKKLRLNFETLRTVELNTVLGGVEGYADCVTKLASGCA